MPVVGFEPTISEGERRQTYALDRAVTGTGYMTYRMNENYRIIYTYQSVSTVVKCSLLIEIQKQPTENVMPWWVDWTQGRD